MSAARVLVLPTVWAVGEEDGGGWGGALARLAAGGGGGLRETGGHFRGAERAPEEGSIETESPARPTGELAFYRKYTEGMLRRYLRLSMEAGRVPSFLGRPMFRGGRVTSYRIRGFDDVVIFVHDIERCLGRLGPRERGLIERIALQEHTQADAAELLGMSLRSVTRRYAEAVDALSGIFLETGLLEPFLECQEAEW